jgi:spore maturation protein CgeB
MRQPDIERVHDVVFVGGVGQTWSSDVLEAVAAAIPSFKWWGYGAKSLSPRSALARAYQGEAWGKSMYEILSAAKICLNRHSSAAHGYANNMRMYEATGSGALLLNDWASNLGDFFELGEEVESYCSAEQAVWKIRWLLDHDDERRRMAEAGRLRTLRDHSYAVRMKAVSYAMERLCQPA